MSQLGAACTHLVTGHSPRHVPAAVVLRLADGVLGHQGALDINADEDTVVLVSNLHSYSISAVNDPLVSFTISSHNHKEGPY